MILTCKQFCEMQKWPSMGALRGIIRRSDKNGFKSAFKRVGRRVLVDNEEFWKCFEKVQK